MKTKQPILFRLSIGAFFLALVFFMFPWSWATIPNATVVSGDIIIVDQYGGPAGDGHDERHMWEFDYSSEQKLEGFEQEEYVLTSAILTITLSSTDHMWHNDGIVIPFLHDFSSKAQYDPNPGLPELLLKDLSPEYASQVGLPGKPIPAGNQTYIVELIGPGKYSGHDVFGILINNAYRLPFKFPDDHIVHSATLELTATSMLKTMSHLPSVTITADIHNDPSLPVATS